MPNIYTGAFPQSISSSDRYGYEGLPPELAAEEQAVNRRQQMANYLIQQGLQQPQGQMAGRFYVPPSPWQGAAGLGQILAGVGGGILADKQRQDISGRSNEMLQKALQNYQQSSGPKITEGLQPTRMVQPEPVMSGIAPQPPQAPVQTALQGPGAPVSTPRSPEDVQRAIVEHLMLSRHPQAQRVGEVMSRLTAAEREHALQRNFLGAMAGFKADEVLKLKQAISGDVGVTQSGAAGRTPLGQIQKIDAIIADMDPNSEEAKALTDLRTKLSTHPNAATTSVNVDTGVPFIKELQTQTAKEVAAGKTEAEVSQGSLRTIQTIKDAIATGNVVTGPTANTQIYLRQLANVLGVSGKDNDEILKNTRVAIQGMAKLQIDSSKSAQGQGAISDYERKLFERAAAGGDLTNVEITALMDAMEKTAQFSLSKHERNVANVKKLPKGGDVLAPFLELQKQGGTAPAAPQVPAGAKQIGTSKGKPVYQLRDGSKVIAE